MKPAPAPADFVSQDSYSYAPVVVHEVKSQMRCFQDFDRNTMSNQDAFDDDEGFVFKPQSITDSECSISLKHKGRLFKEFKTFNQSIFVISEGDLEAVDDSDQKFGTEPKSSDDESLPSAKIKIVEFKPARK